MTKELKKCYKCSRDENTVGLLEMTYRGVLYYVCPQHLPALIHQPAAVADLIPGADTWVIPGEGRPH